MSAGVELWLVLTPVHSGCVAFLDVGFLSLHSISSLFRTVGRNFVSESNR